MFESLVPNLEQFHVYRLAALRDNLIEMLRNRGVSPDSFAEIRDRLRRVGGVFEPNQLIEEVFTPNPNYGTPYRNGRFSSGHWPVFYSALEEQTSIIEVQYHQESTGEFLDLANGDAHPRYFTLYSVEFIGDALSVFPILGKYPELVDESESSYEKCWEIADRVRAIANAVRTPSVRRDGGTCTPVFARHALKSEPTLRYHGRFLSNNGEIVFQVL